MRKYLISIRNCTLYASLAAITLLSVGCARSLSGDTYTREEAQRAIHIRHGVVKEVRVVKLEGTHSQVGTASGAVIGGVAGSTVGQGKGSIIGAVVGAVAGGLAGSAAEEQITKKDALEITVKLDNGETVAVVQEAGSETFARGDRVRITNSGGKSRVTH